MRDFKDPYYTGPGCACCKPPVQDVQVAVNRSSEEVVTAIKEVLDAEQKRTKLGFIQYKRINELLEDI